MSKKKVVINRFSSSKIAVIYNRVSTSEQVDNNSLQLQLKHCRQYAKDKGYTVSREFGNTYESAASDEDRVHFQEMLQFTANPENNVGAVVVYSTSRFTRTGSTKVAEELEARGIRILCFCENYDSSNAEGHLMMSFNLGLSKYDNTKKAENIKKCGRAALEKGRWPSKAPLGYDQISNPKEQIITINEKGKKIRLAFDWKAKGLTNKEIVKELKTIGLNIAKQKLSEIFQNPFYCGDMLHSYNGYVPVRGNHPAIVSRELFDKINKESKKGGYKTIIHPEVPLKGTLICSKCKNKLRASMNSKMKKKYNRELWYYQCSENGCGVSCRENEVHNVFAEQLESYKLKDVLIQPLRKQLELTFKDTHKENIEMLSLMQRRFKAIETEMETVQDNLAMAKEQITKDSCIRKYKKLEQEKIELVANMSAIKEKSSNLDKFLEIGLFFKDNLLKMYELADTSEKLNFLKLVYPKGMLFDNQKKTLEPLEENKFIAIKPCYAYNQYDLEDLAGENTTKNDENIKKQNIVPEAGLEPARS